MLFEAAKRRKRIAKGERFLRAPGKDEIGRSPEDCAIWHVPQPVVGSDILHNHRLRNFDFVRRHNCVISGAYCSRFAHSRGCAALHPGLCRPRRLRRRKNQAKFRQSIIAGSRRDQLRHVNMGAEKSRETSVVPAKTTSPTSVCTHGKHNNCYF
jgi:hypothetical protein